MNFKDLLDYCRAEAIVHTLASDEASVWRKICRNYSKKFATPLHQCLDGTIPPEDIILAEFEDQLSVFKEEDHMDIVLDEIYSLEDPDYERTKSKEVDDFLKQAEEEEAARIAAGKPIHKAMKDESTLETLPEKPVDATPKKTGGSINLSYLAREEEN